MREVARRCRYRCTDGLQRQNGAEVTVRSIDKQFRNFVCLSKPGKHEIVKEKLKVSKQHMIVGI